MASVGEPVLLITLPLRPTIVATSEIWPWASATPGSARIRRTSETGMLAGALRDELVSWRLETITSAPLEALVNRSRKAA